MNCIQIACVHYLMCNTLGTLDIHGDKSKDYLYTLMFTVSDENLSWYLDDNIEKYCKTPTKVNKDDEDFQESNKMHCEQNSLKSSKLPCPLRDDVYEK